MNNICKMCNKEKKIKVRIPNMLGDKTVEMTRTELINSQYSHYLLFDPNSREQVRHEELESLDLRPLDHLIGLPPIVGG